MVREEGSAVRPGGGPEFLSVGVTLKAMLSLELFSQLYDPSKMVKVLGVLLKISFSKLPKSQGKEMDLNSLRMNFIVAVNIVFLTEESTRLNFKCKQCP